jgi:hypothetical protein
MNKALRATILVVAFSLSFVGTTLLLQGCGGGGGATIGETMSAQLRLRRVRQNKIACWTPLRAC